VACSGTALLYFYMLSRAIRYTVDKMEHDLNDVETAALRSRPSLGCLTTTTNHNPHNKAYDLGLERSCLLGYFDYEL
jgi:hypothetical protein